eukprot:6173968-Pleurochrysis_carterae.AAC.1
MSRFLAHAAAASPLPSPHTPSEATALTRAEGVTDLAYTASHAAGASVKSILKSLEAVKLKGSESIPTNTKAPPHGGPDEGEGLNENTACVCERGGVKGADDCDAIHAKIATAERSLRLS